MVILHIAHLDSNPFGGVNLVVPEHVRAQQKLEQVGFINITNLPAEGVDNQFAYRAPFRFSNLPEPFSKPDVVVFHEVYRPAFLQIYREADRLGIPYVVVPHACLTVVTQKHKWVKKKVGNLLLFNRFIDHAAAVQCLSQKEYDETKFGRKKFVATNGITKSDRKKVLSRGAMKFVYIGRLHIFVKGLDQMLEAASLCREEMRAYGGQIHIYGPDFDGSIEQLQEMIRQLGLENLVFVHRAVSGEEKAAVLRDTDYFIQTARADGMPMGVLEALAAGIPCLVTKGTGLCDLVNQYQAGLGCANDANEIARCLAELLRHREELQQYSNGALKLIDAYFDWEVVARQTIAAYRTAANVG